MPILIGKLYLVVRIEEHVYLIQVNFESSGETRKKSFETGKKRRRMNEWFLFGEKENKRHKVEFWEEKDSGQRIVVKYYQKMKRYRKEKKMLDLLKYERFIPKLIFTDDKHMRLGMQYVGKNLCQFKKKDRGRFNPQIREMNTLVVEGYGIHHNDVAYRNVTLHEGKLYLIDFELAAFSRRKTRWNPDGIL